MNDYISKAQAVAQTIAEIEALDIIEVCKALEQKIKNDYISQPSADVVEVVRCGECEYWKCNPNTDEYGVCKKVSYDDFEVVMDADDFCSYGEKKEQDNE